MAWLRLARVQARIGHRAVEQLRPHGLTLAQFDVLAHVGAAPGLTQQALAEALVVTKGNVCQVLDRLERADLLVRRQAGRANHLFLTPRGQALYDVVVPEHEALIAEQFSALAPSEQVRLHHLLRRLDHALLDGRRARAAQPFTTPERTPR